VATIYILNGFTTELKIVPRINLVDIAQVKAEAN